ncbi:MAG: FHA domain-containing protein [Ornithinimicrobium sp.]
MVHRFNIDADLEFSISTPGSDGQDGEHVSGTVVGRGRHIEVRSDGVGAMSSGASLGQARAMAAELARWGLTVSVVGPEGPVVTVGDVEGNRFARLLTRSKHIRIDDWRQAAALRGGSGGGGSSRGSGLPPGTPWPPAPTFRWSRRPLTTTHDPDGGGHPRLVMAMGEHAQDGQARRVFSLVPRGARIGSAEDSDLRLDGVDPLQARVRRDPNDEYVLVAMGEQTPTKFNGSPLAPGDERVLRTGSRMQLGEWTMTYTREEYADHGRPYGGRAGGEFARQRQQPPPSTK